MADKGRAPGKRKASRKRGTPEKRSFVQNRQRKVEDEDEECARRLTADQITDDQNSAGRAWEGKQISIRPGGGRANNWDSDLTDDEARPRVRVSEPIF